MQKDVLVVSDVLLAVVVAGKTTSVVKVIYGVDLAVVAVVAELARAAQLVGC